MFNFQKEYRCFGIEHTFAATQKVVKLNKPKWQQISFKLSIYKESSAKKSEFLGLSTNRICFFWKIPRLLGGNWLINHSNHGKFGFTSCRISQSVYQIDLTTFNNCDRSSVEGGHNQN